MNESGVRRLAIERYVAGELTGAAAKELEEHVRVCSACGAFLTKLSSQKKDFLQTHPFAEFRRNAARLATAESWFERFLDSLSRPALRPALIPVCALLLIGVMALPFAGKMNWRSQQENRSKGFPSQLSYIYKRDGVIRQSAPRDLFRAGDRIMISYASSMERYITVVSIDRSGVVSFYHPDARSEICSIRSGVGSRLAYPVSIELDSTGGAELVAALFSEKPFDTNQIKRWAQGFTGSGDMNALEREMQNNPPVPESSVKTLLLNKG